MGTHRNRAAIKKIEKRLGTKERPIGIDFVTKGNGYEYAETKEDIKDSLNQLSRSRVPGTKKLIIPDNLRKVAIEMTKGTGFGIENISGTIIKKSRKKSKYL